MRSKKAKHWMLRFALALACCALGTGSLPAQQSTTRAPRDAASQQALNAVKPSPGGVSGCQKRVGILGNYFTPEMEAFLVANGLTVTQETATTIAGGALKGLDVLYVNRNGSVDATAQAAAIEAWVRGGGALITEFDATELLFNGTFGFFPAATLDQSFGVPSGNVCGGNTVSITSAANPLAAGLPSSWSCSGDPIGVFKVYNEATLSPALERVARVQADLNQDGAGDLVFGTSCVENGAVVPFFTDFGDWTALEIPRVCPNASCSRSIEDEMLMLNAVCRVQVNCKPMDHFLCYKVKRHKHFRRREVVVRNQFGEQHFTVLRPDTLCVPSTKELKR